MGIRQRMLMIAILGLLGLGLPALAQQGADEQDRARRALEQARKDPALFAKLRQDYETFLSLPSAEQDRLRQIDQALHGLSSPDRAKLHRAMDRYAVWFEQLSEDERRQIQDAPTDADRVKVIKKLRQAQWIERLPKGQREKVKSLKGAARRALIQDLRKEEKRRQREWQVSLKHWDELQKGAPRTRLSELPPATQKAVQEHLMPRLRKDELQLLTDAEGKWPDYLETLTDLNNKVFMIPGPMGPRWVRQLSAYPPLQKTIRNLPPDELRKVRELEGKWPEFALRAAQIARQYRVKVSPPFAPAAPGQFPPYIQAFIKEMQDHVLNLPDVDILQKAEGKWPAYPLQLTRLARKHGRQIPGTVLPGLTVPFWDSYKTKSPLQSMTEYLGTK